MRCACMPSAWVRSPCLHQGHSAEFIVSEYLFDKGLEGFESNAGFSVVKDYVFCQRKGCVGTASFIHPYVSADMYSRVSVRSWFLLKFISCLWHLADRLLSRKALTTPQNRWAPYVSAETIFLFVEDQVSWADYPINQDFSAQSASSTGTTQTHAHTFI